MALSPAFAANVQLTYSAGYSSDYTTFTVLAADGVRNLDSSGTSGNVRLELWASTAPFNGNVASGRRASFYNVGPVAAGTTVSNISGVVPFTLPGGTWYFAVALTEFTGAATNDGYVIRQYFNFGSVSITGSSGGDSTAPTVSLTSPTGGTVSGTVTVSANASDNVGVSRVDFYVNGAKVGSDSAAPYQYSWNTAVLPNGSATLRAIAIDAAGNSANSALVTVNVANAAPGDTTPPTAAITAPTGGNVSGTVTVSANASDNVGVTRVDFYVNGTLAGSDSAAPYQYSWNTAVLANGSATLRAVAFDAAGNSAQSSLVTVNVANGTAPPVDKTPPTVSITSPTGGNVSGTVTVTANAGDNVGVSRVEFYVNGGLAAQAKGAQYQFAWNTSGLPNGLATLRAAAFDAAGNSALSTFITVNIANGAASPPSGGGASAAVSDVNGDGRSDVLWRNATTGIVSEWRMNGFTVLSGANTIGTAAGAQWTMLGVGDFDGDGKADILWQNTATGEVNVWFIDGTTIKPTSRNITAINPAQWQFAGIGDVNDDGKSDVIWRNRQTGDVYVWLMNGSVWMTGSGYLATATLDWQIIGVGDFNGDGKADLLWRNTQTGVVYVWFLNGMLMQPGSGIVTTLSPSRWGFAGTGDFDGDGKTDIVWRDLANGDVHIWLMSGLGLKPGSGYVMSASPSATIAAVADYDGDGKADLLWRDSSQLISIWLMNGMTIKASAGVASVAADWQLARP